MKKFLILKDGNIINVDAIAYLEIRLNYDEDAGYHEDLYIALIGRSGLFLAEMLGTRRVDQLVEIRDYIYRWFRLEHLDELKLRYNFYDKVVLPYLSGLKE